MDHDETWHGSRPRPRPHCVRWGPNFPLSKRGTAPQFLGHVCCGETAVWIKMPLRTNVDLSPGHIVLDEDPAPPTKNGHSSPQVSAHVCCGQMAGWIKMPLGREVDLSPGHNVLDGDRAPQEGPSPFPPIFGQCLLCANGWMDQDASWYGWR